MAGSSSTRRWAFSRTPVRSRPVGIPTCCRRRTALGDGGRTVNAIAEGGEVGGEHEPAVAPAQGGQRRYPLDGQQGRRSARRSATTSAVDAASSSNSTSARTGQGNGFTITIGNVPSSGCDPDAPGNRLHGEVEGLGGHGAGVAVLVPGVLVGRGDGRPGQDVVELVEQYELPGLGQLGRGVGRAAQVCGYGGPALGRQQRCSARRFQRFTPECAE